MNCSECGSDINQSMRFCTNCGAKLHQSGFGTEQNRRGQSAETNYKTRRFDCKKGEFENKVSGLQSWFAEKHYEVQRLLTEDGKQLIQASKRGQWRKLVGMSTATNVLLSHHNNKLTVEIGEGQWLDKAAGGLLGTIVNPLFLVPAGFGALEQWQLPDKVFAHLAGEEGA